MSYAGFFNHPALSYTIILHSIQPSRTPSYTGLFSHPTLSYLILPLDCSAILPYRTLAYILPQPTTHDTLSYPIIHPITFFHVLPHHTSYLNVLRPTLACSAILPCRTSYHNLLRPTLDCSYRLVQPSYLLVPHPTTTFFVLHWIVQPSYLIVPYHTAYYIFPRPTLPGLFSHPTFSYPVLPPPTNLAIQCRTIQCRTKKGVVGRGSKPKVGWPRGICRLSRRTRCTKCR